MFLINNIEEIARIVVSAVQRIKLGPVHLIDNGDGQALPRFAAAYPNAVAEVLRSLCATTGVDITALLARPPELAAAKEVRS
jgi:flotillin